MAGIRLVSKCSLLLALMLLLSIVGAQAQKPVSHDRHISFSPDEIDWQDASASVGPGARIAVLEGSPAAQGVLTMRISFPDGHHLPPHIHPSVERITVLAGTFVVGTRTGPGEWKIDRLTAGSFAAIPPGMVHYAEAEGETVVQVTVSGPWQITYVPEDDVNDGH